MSATISCPWCGRVRTDELHPCSDNCAGEMARLLAPILGHDFAAVFKVCGRDEFTNSSTKRLPDDYSGLSMDDCRRLGAAIAPFTEERLPERARREDEGVFVRFLFADGSEIVLDEGLECAE